MGLGLRVANNCSLEDSGSNLGNCNGVSVVDGLGWEGGRACYCCGGCCCTGGLRVRAPNFDDSVRILNRL